MNEKYCHFALEARWSGSAYAIQSQFNEAKCCGKIARLLVYGCLPVCAEHYDFIETVDERRKRSL